MGRRKGKNVEKTKRMESYSEPPRQPTIFQQVWFLKAGTKRVKSTINMRVDKTVRVETEFSCQHVMMLQIYLEGKQIGFPRSQRVGHGDDWDSWSWQYELMVCLLHGNRKTQTSWR